MFPDIFSTLESQGLKKYLVQ